MQPRVLSVTHWAPYFQLDRTNKQVVLPTCHANRGAVPASLHAKSLASSVSDAGRGSMWACKEGVSYSAPRSPAGRRQRRPAGLPASAWPPAASHARSAVPGRARAQRPRPPQACMQMPPARPFAHALPLLGMLYGPRRCTAAWAPAALPRSAAYRRTAPGPWLKGSGLRIGTHLRILHAHAQSRVRRRAPHNIARWAPQIHAVRSAASLRCSRAQCTGRQLPRRAAHQPQRAPPLRSWAGGCGRGGVRRRPGQRRHRLR